MKLLAIETSSTACSIALLINDEVKALHEIAPMQQAQSVLPMIDKILQAADIKLNQLDALAFGCGPGSFTGVRIATSVSQGIGYATNIPLIPISSLAGLAQAAHQDLDWNQLLVGVDARIQEVYWGAYQVNKNGLVELIGNELVCPPEEVIIPQGFDWSGVGNAWEAYPGQIPYQPIQLDTSRLPMATGILTLAKTRYENQDWVKPEQALPTYLRDEVAKKSQPS